MVVLRRPVLARMGLVLLASAAGCHQTQLGLPTPTTTTLPMYAVSGQPGGAGGMSNVAVGSVLYVGVAFLRVTGAAPITVTAVTPTGLQGPIRVVGTSLLPLVPDEHIRATLGRNLADMLGGALPQALPAVRTISTRTSRTSFAVLTLLLNEMRLPWIRLPD